jgi:hypothetical protein
MINEFDDNTPKWVKRYIDTYNTLNKDNLSLLANIYDEQVSFTDPLSHVSGLNELEHYFLHLYENLKSCQFTVSEVLVDSMGFNDNSQESNNREQTKERAALYWSMTMQHAKINQGREINVNGHSRLIAVDGKVIDQVDYFDVSTMIYEHIPLLGCAIRFIKTKASHQVSAAQ